MKRLLAVMGLAVGLGLGLLYAWVISPVQYTDTAPLSLRADYKADYIRLVAGAFAVDGDVERARARLAMLEEADLAQTVTALAQRTAASDGDSEAVRSLAALAAALGVKPSSPTPTTPSAPTEIATLSPSPVPASSTPSPTLSPKPSATVVPSITPRLLPTRTPTPTPLGAFQYVGKQLVCDPLLGEPLIQVLTVGSNDEQIPGVEVVVEWDGGFDRFFTGLKPELGRGYGDFAMTAGVEYTVHLVESPSAVVGGLRVETCEGDLGLSFPGSWRLVFRQP